MESRLRGSFTWSRESLVPLLAPFQARKILTKGTQTPRPMGTSNTDEKGTEATFDNAAIGLGHLSIDGRWLRANHRLAEFVSSSARDLAGASFFDFVRPEDIPELKQAMRDLVSAESEDFSRSLALCPSEGCPSVVAATFSIVRNIDGAPGYFIIAARPTDSSKDSRAEDSPGPAPGRRTFLRDILASVSAGRFHLCHSRSELPEKAPLNGQSYELSRIALRRMREHLEQLAADLEYPDQRWQDLVTSVGEAAVNAIVHGGGGEAHIHYSPEGTVQAWVEDQGPGIATENLHRATLERGFTTAGTLGHGFWMMRQFADEIWLLTGPEGTTVVLEQHPQRPASAGIPQTQP